MKPAEGPLDNPTPRNHLETLLDGMAASDFHINAEAGTMVDDFGPVAVADPRFGDARVVSGDARKHMNATGIVGDAGGRNQHGQEEAECVDADVAFAACDLLACVEALTCRRHVS
ncbi:hypothetical protein QF048_004827 [Streptomyces sp. W4I9-2]|nr:hypothetical protein [Streptomyces sp. W4I9-2]